jgi:transposase
MPHYVGLDVSQNTASICIVDEQGRRLWRGVCATHPDPITTRVLRHAGASARIGIETGPMTPWLVHGLRTAGLDVACLDARRVKAALQMRLNKTDENDAEGLAQVMCTGWYRPVHVKSLDAHRARALLGARAQLVGMTTRLSNMIRGVLKTFGLLAGAGRGLRFDRKVEALLDGSPELEQIVRPFARRLAATARADCHVRQGSTAAGPSRPDLSSADDRTGDWGALLPGLRHNNWRARPLRSLSSRGCPPRADPAALSVGRDRPKRAHLQVW